MLVESRNSEAYMGYELKHTVPHVSILGIGGAGCNIVSLMAKNGSEASILALNSDARHLSVTKAEKRILLGYNTTSGLGCMGFPERGARAAKESAGEIAKELFGSQVIFIVAGLGGGTGTGAAPVVAEIAKSQGAAAIGVVTIPFQIEKTRWARAKEGLEALIGVCDAVIVVDNGKLLKTAGNLPLSQSLVAANRLIARFLRNLSDMLVEPCSPGFDLSLKALMTENGVCTFGFGEGFGYTKVKDSIRNALANLLLDVRDLRKAEGAIIHVEGGEDMKAEDLKEANKILMKKIASNARVSCGVRLNNSMYDSARATIVLAGVESPFQEKRSRKLNLVSSRLKRLFRD